MDGMGHSVNDILSGVPTRLFLGGEFRDASDGGTFEVRDPATDGVLVEVASATEADARRALLVQRLLPVRYWSLIARAME